MAEGWVKSFNSEKGYGCLTVLAYSPGDIRVDGHDVPVHFSEIQMTGYRTLDAGEYVSFAVERNREGNPHARHVTPLSPPSQFLLDFYAAVAAQEEASRAPRRAVVRRLPVPLPVLLVFVAVLVALVAGWLAQ